MARIIVPKNISETGSLYTEESPAQIKERIADAKATGNEFIEISVSDAFGGYKRALTLKTSLIQAYE